MKSYKTTIGLEVHAELNTKSKMFCSCKNAPHGSEPNANVCPVCMAHPGTLPVPNQSAIEMVLLFGQAIAATKATYSEFDRKNYFYPDIPKAYQISQYQFPFLTGGQIAGVELTRVHLEEDTARSSHEEVDGSLVDFNRAGVPLMELVTEPVLHDAESAGAFARELQLILQTLGISHANMERGEMRIEANISISDTEELGSKVEVKNINSFKAVESAIRYEVARQKEVLESGGVVTQETRGWDENKSQTFSQRTKETAKDYRYFPDPDITKIQVDKVAEFASSILAEKVPALPSEKRLKYKEFEISDKIISVIISNKILDKLFAEVVAKTNDVDVIKLAANYVSVDLLALLSEGSTQEQDLNIDHFLELMQLTVRGDIGSRGTKDILGKLTEVTKSVAEYAEASGLMQVSDVESLNKIILEVISQNTEQVADFKNGKETVLKYLVGQGMKLSKGAANPQVLEEMLCAEMSK